MGTPPEQATVARNGVPRYAKEPAWTRGLSIVLENAAPLVALIHLRHR